MTSIWLWHSFSTEDPALQMETDRTLWHSLQPDSFPQIRFYRWSKPTLSFGRTQGISPQMAEHYQAQGWTLVRRPTGGGLVLHEGDTCCSLFWRKNHTSLPWGVRDSYRAIHAWVQKSLVALGQTSELWRQDKACAPMEANDKHWCFKAPVCDDLLVSGEKIVGGAQLRSRGVALHQGSIQRRFSEEEIAVFRKTFEVEFSVKTQNVRATTR